MPHQMPDSPDQMIYTLQQENKNLKKILKEKEKKLQQKGRELQQKVERLDLERSLWKSRDGDWDASKGAVLHRLDVLNDIIRDADKLHQATLADGTKFRHMLERAEEFLVHSGQMPLFRDDDRRASDRATGAGCTCGTRCSWRSSTRRTTPRRGCSPCSSG